MNLSKKLKLLRKTEGYTQVALSKVLRVGYPSIQNYECGYRKPNHRFMQKLCQQFPEYTLWLMTDIDDVENIKNQAIKQ
jgi:transcriptional regulator with XRE-family HTH domain